MSIRCQLNNWKEVLKQAEKQYPHNYNLYAYTKEVIQLSNTSKLSERDIIELAMHIGLKIYPRDKVYQNYLGSSKQIITGLPIDWIPTLNSDYLSMAYHNPVDILEYIAIVPSTCKGYPHIIHHTSEEPIDPDWFNKVVPILYDISLKDRPQRELGVKFKNEKLTLGQMNTINHFFKADPILKISGVCTKCYTVSFPIKGFGIRYLYKGKITEVPPQGIIKEIRFSARKPSAPFENCQRPYVTELVVAGANMQVQTKEGLELTKKNDEIWTMIDPSTTTHKFSNYNTRPEVHIDARIYDFDKLTLRLPVCHCKT